MIVDIWKERQSVILAAETAGHNVLQFVKLEMRAAVNCLKKWLYIYDLFSPCLCVYLHYSKQCSKKNWNLPVNCEAFATKIKSSHYLILQ